GVIANLLDLADHGILGAALDDPALVLGDGAEGAAAETAALDGHGEANHLVGGYVGFAVQRVRLAPVGPLVHPVDLARRERNRWRIQPHIDIPMPLYEGACVAGVGFKMQDAR